MNDPMLYLEENKSELFRKFSKIFISMINHRVNQKFKYPKELKFEYYQQEFFKRYFDIFTAVNSNYDSLNISYNKTIYEISLLPAVMTLIRSCLENYSLFHYIYFNSKDTDETILKFKLWWREGFIRRQSFYTSEKEFLLKKEDERKMIDQYFEEIHQSEYYNQLSKKQQDKLEKHGTWIFKSYRDLLVLAGFDQKSASNIYNYFCSYTHTSSVGLMQTAQANSETKKRMIDTFLNPFFMATGNYLFLYQSLLENYKMNEKDYELIIAWKEIMKSYI